MFLLKTFGLICAAYGILSVLTGCDSTVGFKSQVRTETWEAVVILEGTSINSFLKGIPFIHV